MHGTPTDYWAKLDVVTGASRRSPSAWHPLTAHSADVAACCEALLERTVLRRRLAHLAGLDDLDDAHVARLCFLSALHDVGKFNCGFQNKALDKPPFVRGHVREGLGLLANADRAADGDLYDILCIDELVSWGESPAATGFLLIAAICHHGQPYKWDAQEYDPHWWQPVHGRSPFEAMSELVAMARNWFPDAFGADAQLPDHPAFQHGFAGLVMLADWMGSSADFFPFEDDVGADRMPMARRNAQQTVERLTLDPKQARAVLGGELVGFGHVMEFAPYEIQSAVLDLPVPEAASITVLEAETGSGKTEAALGRFLQMFQAGAVDGMYFALPTRSAASQIHRRIIEVIRRAFGDDPARPSVLLAVPGYVPGKILVDDVHAKLLPEFEVQWPDDHADRYRYRGWAAENSKRYLAGSVVVGTIDQVLLSTVVVKHAHLRATTLTRHLLVVDEVHASDAYMTRLLESVLEFHIDAGGHALLMSATLGSTARTGLLRSVASVSEPTTLEDASAAPYPAIAHSTRDSDSVHMAAPGAPGNPKRFRSTIEPRASDCDWIARRALDAARDGARVLVIRNLVDDCIATQLAVERSGADMDREQFLWRCHDQPTAHHSRYAREDRLDLDTAIESAFGKDRPVGGCVAVATQTVQQSLDLDADLMITDLCPIDVLLQRVGRLHRHGGRTRPPGFESAVVIVLRPQERALGSWIGSDGFAIGPHGLGTVYRDLRVLEATLCELENHSEVEIPGMARRLTEAAIHPEALQRISSTRGPEWERHERFVLGELAAEVSVGSINLIDRSKAYGTMGFPSREKKRRISTRLGNEDRLVAFPQFASPFGNDVGELTFPGHWCRDWPLDPQPTITAHRGGKIEFSILGETYIYDRLGLRKREEGESA